MAKCYACKNYQSGYCKLTGTHSYTGDICNKFVNKEQAKMLDDSKSELRVTKHALWMARAIWNHRVVRMAEQDLEKCKPSTLMHFVCKLILDKWKWAERKCREKAKEFE